MSKQKSREEIIQHKKTSIRKINNLFESYINANDSTQLKKVDILAYWLEEFCGYIYAEDTFDPQKLISYKRGNVIRVNLGFRVGNEMGGLHYAVVLENNNAHSSGVVTVIPLSSTDGRDVHPNNVDLGSELYSKAEAQRLRLLEEAKKELNETKILVAALTSVDANSNITQAIQTYEDKLNGIQKTIKTIEHYDRELAKMKLGSMAVINQITTISKQRIYTPKKSEDFLYNVSLSESAMEKINKKLVEKLLH